MRSGRIVALTASLLLLGAACSGGSDAVEVEDPWGRPSPMSEGNAAFYMDLLGSDTDDTLVSAASPACGMVELHESQMTDGVMSMQHLPEGIPVPAGETVSLEPGGLHVMCMMVQDPLVEGEAIDVTLVFENTGEVEIEAEVRQE